jgi:hypothetical protein
MTIPRVGVVFTLAIAAACGGTRYYADVPGRSFDVSGDYVVDEVLARNGCRTLNPLSRKGHVTVEHSPNATAVALIRGDESFVGSIRSDGRFKTDPAVTGPERSAMTTWIEGRFNVSGMEATVHFQTGDTTLPAGPADRLGAKRSGCEYTMRWSGKKL